MSIRAVIFDMGGTLLRTENHPARRKWEARLGLREGELSRTVFESDASERASIGLLDEDGVWKHVQATFKLSDEQMREFVPDFWSGDVVDAALIKYMDGLRPRYKTAILSNAFSTGRWAIAEKFGLRDAVDMIIISAEEGVAKPDPRIYQLAADRLKVTPDECIFVDDVEKNVRAAQALGMCGVQFKDTAQAIAAIESYLEKKTPIHGGSAQVRRTS